MWVDANIEKCDVKGAKRGSCHKCPGARAVTRLLGDEWIASLHHIDGDPILTILPRDTDEADIEGCCLFPGTDAFEIAAPKNLADYARAYDKSKPGKLPEPVAVRLNIPKRFLKDN